MSTNVFRNSWSVFERVATETTKDILEFANFGQEDLESLNSCNTFKTRRYQIIF